MIPIEVKLGQRYLYSNFGIIRVEEIIEISNVRDYAKVRIIQCIDDDEPEYYLNRVYTEYWFDKPAWQLLQNQEAPLE